FYSSVHDSPTTEIYSLSLHDALPICLDVLPGPAPLGGAGLADLGSPRPWVRECGVAARALGVRVRVQLCGRLLVCQDCPRCGDLDRKSTRLNSSHVKISYAVFCLKKK